MVSRSAMADPNATPSQLTIKKKRAEGADGAHPSRAKQRVVDGICGDIEGRRPAGESSRTTAARGIRPARSTDAASEVLKRSG
jgi:hypothetical protein